MAALLLSSGAAHAAQAAQPSDWVAELRQAVQLDPARGERLAIEIEGRARQEPRSTTQQLRILTAQYFRAEALLQLNRAAAAAPIVDEALRNVPATAAGSKLKGQLLMARAGIFSGEGKAALSLRDFQAAYRLFVEVKNPRNAAVALMGIGSIYQDAGDANRVLYYYKLADETYSGDALLGLSSANNQANALAGVKRYREAEASYRKALSFARQLRSPLLEARILNNIAAMQIDLGQPDTAAATLDRGLAVADREPAAAAWRPLLLGTKAQLMLSQNRIADSIGLIERAKAGKKRSDFADQSYRDFHQTAYQAYLRGGRSDQALPHLETFRKLDDEGRALVTETSAALLAARFDFANQNVRISALKTGQLQRDIALAQLTARQNAILLGSLLAVATVIAVGLALYLRSLKKSRDAVSAANVALTDVNAQLSLALSAKSRFLATTSHEIRTPLNGVLGMAQVLLADTGLSADVRQRLSLLRDAGETMRHLVDDILEFAKMDAGSVEIEKNPCDLHAMLDESVRFWRPQAESAGLEIALQAGGVPRHIVEDARRLRQIIYNLLANAIKFTESGRIVVAANVSGEPQAETLSIAVSDTGIGIPEDAFGPIFEMFNQLDTSTTRRFSGSGLGLAISLNLARALGGELRVASTLGSGSTFTLELPLVRAPAPVAGELGTTVRSSAPATDMAQARVIMIGGSPIAQQIITSLLKDRVGAFVTVATLEAATADLPWPTVDALIVDSTTILEADFSMLVDQISRAHVRPRLMVLGPAEGRLGGGAAYRQASVLARPFTAAELIEALARLFHQADVPAFTDPDEMADKQGQATEKGRVHADPVR